MGLIEWIIIIVLALFVLNFFLPTKGVTDLTVEQAKEKINQKNIQCIDVRTPEEFRMKNRPQFKNIPLYELESKVHTLDKEKDVVVICQSGMRSKRAAKLLKKYGFKNIYNVKGGMNAWY